MIKENTLNTKELIEKALYKTGLYHSRNAKLWFLNDNDCFQRDNCCTLILCTHVKCALTYTTHAFFKHNEWKIDFQNYYVLV